MPEDLAQSRQALRLWESPTMAQLLTTGLLWFSAIGCGLVAGVYFAFSTFIMTSFARVAPAAGFAAMNAINVDIVKSVFMPVFFGTTLAAAILAGFALFRWSGPGSTAVLAGGVIYVIGTIGVTLAFNVPLNDALAAVDPSSVEGASLWARYVRDWTFWNHVRLFASIIASVLFIVGLVWK
jgi:uncharacterized membrane protein